MLEYPCVVTGSSCGYGLCLFPAMRRDIPLPHPEHCRIFFLSGHVEICQWFSGFWHVSSDLNLWIQWLSAKESFPIWVMSTLAYRWRAFTCHVPSSNVANTNSGSFQIQQVFFLLQFLEKEPHDLSSLSYSILPWNWKVSKLGLCYWKCFLTQQNSQSFASHVRRGFTLKVYDWKSYMAISWHSRLCIFVQNNPTSLPSLSISVHVLPNLHLQSPEIIPQHSLSINRQLVIPIPFTSQHNVHRQVLTISSERPNSFSGMLPSPGPNFVLPEGRIT